MKAEFRNEATDKCEWMWGKMEYADEANRRVFGWIVMRISESSLVDGEAVMARLSLRL